MASRGRRTKQLRTPCLLRKKRMNRKPMEKPHHEAETTCQLDSHRSPRSKTTALGPREQRRLAMCTKWLVSPKGLDLRAKQEMAANSTREFCVNLKTKRRICVNSNLVKTFTVNSNVTGRLKFPQRGCSWRFRAPLGSPGTTEASHVPESERPRHLEKTTSLRVAGTSKRSKVSRIHC